MIVFIKELINFFKNKIELFPFIFDSIKGKPFKEKIYFFGEKKQKVEFFYLTQSKYYKNLVKMDKYLVWTVKESVYRVFIDKYYYQEFKFLFQKKINMEIMIFFSKLLKKRLEIIHKNFFYLFLSFILNIICLIFKLINNFESNEFYVFFVVFFLFLIFYFFLIIKKQNRFFKKYKEFLFKSLICKIKTFLKEDIIEEQILYDLFYYNVKKKR